jgi:hypothetical protein
MAGTTLIANNVRTAKRRWRNSLDRASLNLLRSISKEFGFSVANGDLLLLDNGWYVTHVGLVRLARRNRCFGIDSRPAGQFCDPASSRWAFKATVYRSRTCRVFTGYGDANPSNVSPQVRGAEMRVAETRAVNRALRKAYGIGICSVEELGSFSGPFPFLAAEMRVVVTSAANGLSFGLDGALDDSSNAVNTWDLRFRKCPLRSGGGSRKLGRCFSLPGQRHFGASSSTQRVFGRRVACPFSSRRLYAIRDDSS